MTQPVPDRPAFDPRARIIALALFVAAACAAFRPAALVPLALLAVVLLTRSGITAKEAAARLVPVNIFLALVWLTLPFLAEGPYRRVLNLVDVSPSGVLQSLSMTLKANAIVIAACAMLHPVEFGGLAVALRRLGVPEKLVWLFILSHRYVVGLANTVRKSAMAIRMRSGNGGKGVMRAYGGLFAKLFVGGHQGGDRLYTAMRARGYGADARGGLALVRELHWRGRDTALVAGMAYVACFILWLDRAA